MRRVSILVRKDRDFKLTATYWAARFQLIHEVAAGVPLLEAYVAPLVPKVEFQRMLQIASRCLQGPGVLVGDLNSRHNQWDDSLNMQGIELYRWARQHNFRTKRPPEPTFTSHSGKSRIDLVFHRSPIPPTLTVLPKITHSDHVPVRAELRHVSVATMRQVPLALITNQRCHRKVREQYAQAFPDIIDSLNGTSTAASLEAHSWHLCQTTLHAYTSFCNPRSNRFRLGWTQALDSKAKLRSQLLRSANLAEKQRAKELDREIKRGFHSNRRRLQSQIGDLVAEGNPQTDHLLLKRALAVNRLSNVAPCTVGPDEFTKFMASLQPAAQHTKVVTFQQFEVPDTIRTFHTQSVSSTLKPDKSQGPDMVRTEMFKLSPDLFADTGIPLWRAVGPIAHVPSVLQSGLLVPIYKQQTDPALPTNNRPVCLTPSFRRLISTTLTHQLTAHYQSRPTQWRFRPGTNTECAIAFSYNKLRRELPIAAVMDLRKAYDSVPRQTLQNMLDKQFPAALSTVFSPLLAPMLMRTKHQRSTQIDRTLVGMPEGAPPSPFLFNLFMDGFSKPMNTDVSRRMATLLVNDLLLLARCLIDMQRLFCRSKSWAEDVQMTWALHK